MDALPRYGFVTSLTVFLLVLGIAILLSEGTSLTANFSAGPEVFVVTDANDNGPGSLRQAITDANANTAPGADKIVFNIPGPGVKVINLLTPLPEITDPLIIDASTQPGYAGSPLVELDGTSAGDDASGLVITAGDSLVRGLAINRFQVAGVVLRSGNGNNIQANYIGVDATGTVARSNNVGIQLSNSSNNLLGGMAPAMRNVISGNVIGIEISSNNNIVQGNFVGTNAAGTTAIANTDRGVAILSGSFKNNVIGGGNLISGNGRGISIQAPENIVQGNLIGTDFTGTHKIGNGTGIEAQVAFTLIGGLTPATRNVISGNGTGVIFGQPQSKLQGNFIGTDITGTVALGNTFSGVVMENGGLIGGTVPEARNVISGNGVSNISLGSSFVDILLPNLNTVQGNYIGIDSTGSRALTDPTFSTTKSGIFIFGSRNQIGSNVISGNAVGIRIGMIGLASMAGGNVIAGNLIGLNAAGTGPLPNTQGGIELSVTQFNRIGATSNNSGNKIAFNGGPGVKVSAGSFDNSIRGNSIFSNYGLGIDLGESFITPNDPTDLDVGPNNLQNFPVLTSVISANNSTTIHGTLNSTPNTTFQIDFYSNAALDLSGSGEGARFFNTTSVTTDGNGDAMINVSFPAPLESGRVLTATATDPRGNTSEFSAGDDTGATGSAQIRFDSIRVIEDVGLATATVFRRGGSFGTLTVNYATVDGTATAGQDYTSTSGTLTFSAGETIKSFQIPILDDAISEPDETFSVELRNAGNPEALEELNRQFFIVQDHSTVPIISPAPAGFVEGDAGTTKNVSFTLTLSAATGRLVTVDYATSNQSATGGASCGNQGTDYETTSGTISFQPGNTLVLIPVKLCGDASAEATETFLINLSSPSNATLSSKQLAGTIVDDDQLELLLEELGPTVKQAVALDALLFLRDTFPVVGIPEWFPTDPDRNTRLMFFVRNLQLDPGESPSAVIVRLTASNNQFFEVPAEDVRSVAKVDFAQVVIRLPDTLGADVYTVRIMAHSRTSNAGTIRIAP